MTRRRSPPLRPPPLRPTATGGASSAITLGSQGGSQGVICGSKRRIRGLKGIDASCTYRRLYTSRQTALGRPDDSGAGKEQCRGVLVDYMRRLLA
eukprot:49928-Prorocentrum_minimum.AAC.1